jgi:hypothetical protein
MTSSRQANAQRGQLLPEQELAGAFMQLAITLVDDGPLTRTRKKRAQRAVGCRGRLTHMTARAPRALTTAERDVLELLLSVSFDGVEVLRAQARNVLVTDHCACGCPSIELDVPTTAPAAAVSSCLVPARGQVDPLDDDPAGQIIVLLTDGRLSYLEYLWPTPSPPTTWPPLERITVGLTGGPRSTRWKIGEYAGQWPS